MELIRLVCDFTCKVSLLYDTDVHCQGTNIFNSYNAASTQLVISTYLHVASACLMYSLTVQISFLH